MEDPDYDWATGRSRVTATSPSADRDWAGVVLRDMDLLQRVLDDKPSGTPEGVCEKCAEKMGWTWPKGHVATYWIGACSYCHEKTGVCAESDWDHSGHEKEREL